MSVGATTLSADAAMQLLSMWHQRRELELQRMYNWEPTRWNLRADAPQRAISVAQFDWTRHSPRVYTWASLCNEVPNCESVLRMCLLDPDLVRDIVKKNPGVTDLHGTMADDQKVALVMMVTGFNVFITGSAGVGKSKIIMSGILTLREMFAHASIDMLVTASTGVAAFNIHGLTLHSRLMLMCSDTARYQRTLTKKIETLGALLVDEISMLSVRDFYRAHLHIADTMLALNDKLTTKYGVLPFGGRQLILVGDYFQLSDVKRDFTGVDRADRANNRHAVEVGEFQRVAPEYKLFDKWARAFCTPLWAQTMGSAVLLEEIQRQSDAKFIKFLSDVRWGQINARDAMDFVHAHTKPADQVPDSAMFLFSTNDEASNHNFLKMATLPKPDIYFYMMQLAHKADGSAGGREQLDGELPKHRAQATLRVGSRARIWSNYDVARGISNGTQCQLLGLVPIGRASVMSASGRQRREVNIHESVLAVQRHYAGVVIQHDPARYDYQLLDSSAFHLEWTGDNNSVHLALKPGDSSVHQEEGVHPLELAPSESVVNKYHRAEGAARGTNLNYSENQHNATRGFCVAVRFYHRPENEVYILPPVLSTRTEQLHGKIRPLITQVQLPLIPGYASTVHSAQGLTLESVAISLTRMQDPALPYVAMTRATTSQALYFVGEAGLTRVEPDQKVVALAHILRKAKQ